MTVLSANQVAAAAYLGGFRGNTIAEAVGVAYAESSWNTSAANSCCHGLWQINTQAHPAMKANVEDPVQNAKYAKQIYSSEGGWCRTHNPPNCNPFQGYGNSNYKSAYPKGVAAQKYLEQQIAAAGSTTGAGLGGDVLHSVEDTVRKILGINSGTTAGNALDSAGNALGGLSGIIAFINRMGAWITNPDNILRGLKVAAGAIVIFVGVAALMDKQAMNIIGMTPQGRVLKKVIK